MADAAAPAPDPQTEDALEFLQHLHPGGPDHLVSIFSDGRVDARTFNREETDLAKAWIDKRQGRANQYFHVNPLRADVRNLKARKTDVLAATHLHVDIDDASASVLERIRKFALASTAVVNSGGGFHVYFALREPCSDFARVERGNAALARALGGDTVQNVDRIMRLPGTLNLPNAKKLAKGRKVSLSYVVRELTDWSRKYSIDDFAEEGPGANSAVAVSGTPSSVPLTDFAQLPSELSSETRSLIEFGDDARAPIGSRGATYPSRSEALFRVICDLVRAGCDDQLIAGVILNPKFGVSASVLEKPKPIIYAYRQIESARAAVGNSWPDATKSGHPRPTLRNTMLAIRRLAITCEHDEFHNRKIIGGHALQSYQGELSDDICARLRHLILERFKFDPGKDHTREAANSLCLENSYHPIRQYFGQLAWDGTPRMDEWLVKYMGANDTPLTRAIGRKTLLAAVRRIRSPGAKFDQIVVFEGPQGSGKSTAIEILAGGSANYSDADILTLDPKAQMEALEGVLIYEIGELEGMSRADTTKVKAFASRSVDRGRPAYGRFRENHPRQNIFIGTTNDDKYLRDQTGNRRFWPIRTGSIDLNHLRADRDQLWAEAAHYEATGESLTLPQELWLEAASEQEERVEDDPWLDALDDIEGDVYAGLERVPTELLLKHYLGIEPDRQQQFHTKRLAQLMRKLGWSGPKRLRLPDGKVVRGYDRPTTKPDGPRPTPQREF